MPPAIKLSILKNWDMMIPNKMLASKIVNAKNILLKPVAFIVKIVNNLSVASVLQSPTEVMRQ